MLGVCSLRSRCWVLANVSTVYGRYAKTHHPKPITLPYASTKAICVAT